MIVFILTIPCEGDTERDILSERYTSVCEYVIHDVYYTDVWDFILFYEMTMVSVFLDPGSVFDIEMLASHRCMLWKFVTLQL